MNIKRLALSGLTLLSLAVLTPAWAVNLPGQTINGVQKNLKPAVPASTIIKKTSPANVINLNRVPACPKLFAKGLRVVRVVPQPVRAGEPTYRFILDGNIANRGATGVANAGFNVTQSVQGKPGKRIALKLFKLQVRKKQVLDVNRDLHVTIQSDPLSRAQASRTAFKLNVTNLRNDQGNCGEYNPTVSTLSAAQVSRALPAQVRGVSQQAGVIPPAAKPPARSGFGVPALPVKKSLRTSKPARGVKPLPSPAIKAGLPVPKKTYPLIPGKRVSAQTKPVASPSFSSKQLVKQKPHPKPVQGFGLNKPVTAVGGKSLLSPGATAGPRHTLGGDGAPPPRVGGFAPIPGAGAGIAHAPVAGPGGASLQPAAAPQMKLTVRSAHRSNNRSDDLPADIVGRGDRVLVVFDIKNMGTATGRVKVGRIGRPLFITDGVATVEPGQTASLMLEVPVTNGNNAEGAWKAVFRFMTPTNQEYHDSNMADNYVTASLSFDTWSGDILVESIKNVRVGMSTNGSDSFGGFQQIPWVSEAWQGTGFYTPKTLTLMVKIRNRDIKDTAPRQLTVQVKGLAEYVPPGVRGSRHYPERYSKIFNCSGAECPMSATVTVPALGANTSREIPVTFNNVGYKLWVNDKAGDDGAKGKAHTIRPGGYYMCKGSVRATSLAQIQVEATLDTQGDAIPSNNGLRQSFSVGTWRGSSCQVSRLTDAQAFIP